MSAADHNLVDPTGITDPAPPAPARADDLFAATPKQLAEQPARERPQPEPAPAPDPELAPLVAIARATCGCSGCASRHKQVSPQIRNVLGGGNPGGCLAREVYLDLRERARRPQ